MATKTSSINVRLNSDDKVKAEEILHSMGLSMSSAVNMFVKAVINERRLPINATAPTIRRRGDNGLLEPLSSDEKYMDYVNELLVDRKNDKYVTASQVYKQIKWNS